MDGAVLVEMYTHTTRFVSEAESGSVPQRGLDRMSQLLEIR